LGGAQCSSLLLRSGPGPGNGLVEVVGHYRLLTRGLALAS
jgi:hypothetical protein